ncbi:GntR family transcriptional regulator [Candidatus Viadribacter manganicus]|uniref:HTH gntR-type domain-containing protein n=1 Tax=Candidatus Viadribacter manganicus TaxID=1759059 RepID=A0A1B1AH93_9PROT|nr:GntR family transcriptional regulator [Candidatus Viadribacter manganicus]ANP45911.1 hypothetical protein ATE48_08240 [Candidatus Viadribacter manganicus]
MPVERTAARRAFEEIKARIRDGRLPVRSHIDVEALAEDLALSSMPVRQALAILVWEGLVKAGQRSGYEVSLWSEAELAYLYEWRGVLFALALPNSADGAELQRATRILPYPESMFAVMRLIEASANPELRRAGANADERLYLARKAEIEVLGDVQGELQTLIDALAHRSKRTSVLLKAHTRRRVQSVRLLRQHVVLRALPNNGAPG